jgi:NitT/TauT family transport system ATP-binding protein
MTMPPALAFDAVSCTFAGRDDAARRHTAVQDVTLAVAPGEFVSVVGPTGCGKSTLLNLAAGLLAPSSGGVRVFGAPLAGLNARAGYMFQAESLLPWRTARENVMAGLVFRGWAKAAAGARADEWLARVGLQAFGDRYPHQLSGGMRKRVSLAQVLVLDPDIILMDEPFSALDVQTRQLMENELLALWSASAGERSAAPERAGPSRGPEARGVREACERPPDARTSTLTPSGAGSAASRAVLFITHDLDEAIAMSDRVVVLSAGPAARPIGEFHVGLERPRDVAEIRGHPRFVALHEAIWDVLRAEVLKGYRAQLAA